MWAPHSSLIAALVLTLMNSGRRSHSSCILCHIIITFNYTAVPIQETRPGHSSSDRCSLKIKNKSHVPLVMDMVSDHPQWGDGLVQVLQICGGDEREMWCWNCPPWQWWLFACQRALVCWWGGLGGAVGYRTHTHTVGKCPWSLGRD